MSQNEWDDARPAAGQSTDSLVRIPVNLSLQPQDPTNSLIEASWMAAPDGWSAAPCKDCGQESISWTFWSLSEHCKVQEWQVLPGFREEHQGYQGEKHSRQCLLKPAADMCQAQPRSHSCSLLQLNLSCSKGKGKSPCCRLPVIIHMKPLLDPVCKSPGSP